MLFMCERVFLSPFPIRNLPKLILWQIKFDYFGFYLLIYYAQKIREILAPPLYFRNALKSFVTGIKLLPFATNAPL